MEKRHIVIIGGGYAGVKTALELSKKDLNNIKVTLISDRDKFEHNSAINHLVSKQPSFKLCTPLKDIVNNKNIEIIEDKVVRIYDTQHEVEGKSGERYRYDVLVVGLGGETNHISDRQKEYSHDIKTVSKSLYLKRHVDKVLKQCLSQGRDRQMNSAKFVVVGGGATGVELSADLMDYARARARALQIHPSLVSVLLVESASRLVPKMSEDVSNKIEKQIRSLGIQVQLNREVSEMELSGYAAKDMDIKSGTVIWTTGTKANKLHSDLSMAEFDSLGRVHVDNNQLALGYSNIFVLGSGAATEHSGSIHATLVHSKRAVYAITDNIDNNNVIKIADSRHFFSIPVGKRWSATAIGPLTLYGIWGWILRRIVDMKVYLSLLPFRRALTLFRSSR